MAGMSLRRVRSPVAPKMVRTHGGAQREPWREEEDEAEDMVVAPARKSKSKLAPGGSSEPTRETCEAISPLRAERVP